MIEHLETHEHAFLDNNNVVVNISIFDGHNPSLIEQVKEFFMAEKVICCCDYGKAFVGGDFYNNKFYPPKPYEEWLRDEENSNWIAPEGWVDPNIDTESIVDIEL